MALKPGQLKCIETLDKPLVVAAGAGSGKTFTLTKRMVGALQSGYVQDIGQICAITFTNKAAAELKSRVKEELRACGMKNQSLKADDAWISTIHGMCARILKAHALELDLDPSFALGDESQLRQLRAQAIDGVLTWAQGLAESEEGVSVSAVAYGDRAAQAEAGMCARPSQGEWGAESGCAAEGARDSADGAQGAAGRGGQDAIPAISPARLTALFSEYDARGSYSSVEAMLERLIGVAGANVRGADAFSLVTSPARLAPLVQKALAFYEGLIAAAENQKQSDSCVSWIASATEACAHASAALQKGGVTDARAALRLLAPFGVSRKFGSKEFKEQAADCGQLIDTCIMELRLLAAQPLLETLQALAREALARFVAAKRRRGLLDNDDLLVIASRAFAEHPEIAALYADKFKMVMVDEFQDTNQMQVDMIRRIAGPGACRLCTVGDAQQSIYRFRGADVSVYRRHLASVRAADPDGIILLPDNFRSNADILSLVDRVFSRQDMFGGEFMSLAPGRDEAQVAQPLGADEPRVQLLQVTREHRGGATSAEALAEQARQIARAFAGFHEAGHAAGEMAVLLGRMSNAAEYARALRAAGLPCVVSGGSVFKDSPEARTILDLARVAVNGADTEALFSVLTGPVFRVPDSDLLALATSRDSEAMPRELVRRRRLDVGMKALRRAIDTMRKAEEEDADAKRRAKDGLMGAKPDAHDARLEAGERNAFDAAFAENASAQLRCAARVLGQLQRAVGRTALSRALMRAIVDAGWVSRLEGEGPEGLACAANAYKAIRMIEDIEADRTAGPVGILSVFEELLELAKEAPGALSTDGGDFVRIMTVHASKGLEFPIVAVSEFRNGTSSAPKLMSIDAGSRILLSLDLDKSLDRIGGAVSGVKPDETVYPAYGAQTDDEESLRLAALNATEPLALRAALRRFDAIGEAEEEKRLLYVALTRAKEALVISFASTRTKRNPNGMPSACLGSLVAALAGNEEGFEPGVSHCDFGGSRQAIVRHIALEKNENAAGSASELACGGNGSTELFSVPVPSAPARVYRVTYLDAHQGIFSYSSVAGATHGTDLISNLVRSFAISCDKAANDPFGGNAASADDQEFGFRQLHADRLAAMGDEDDGSWAYLGSDARDADKATDFGTAFHRLAQYAVDRWTPESGLQKPSGARIRTMMKACRLDGRQWSRLDDALDRWFACDEAREIGTWPRLAAEVPFFLAVDLPDESQAAEAGAAGAGVADGSRGPVPTGAGADSVAGGGGATAASPLTACAGGSEKLAGHAMACAYLEGEIDLLALSEDGSRAWVVDYKTGGHADETEERLYRKHVLQASCYAWALIRQGVREVRTSFVRVERSREGDAHEPQCVWYRFSADDEKTLETAIAQAYLLSRKGGE